MKTKPIGVYLHQDIRPNQRLTESSWLEQSAVFFDKTLQPGSTEVFKFLFEDDGLRARVFSG